MARVCLLILGFCFLTGCAPVAPWERGHLARQDMAADPNRALTATRRQVFDSREGSRGGAGSTAGGCGCN